MTEQRRLFYEELGGQALVRVEYCTDEENENLSLMPEAAVPNNTEKAPGTKYYHRYVSDLTDEEMKLFLMAKHLSTLKVIRNCLITFVLLTILGFVIGIFVH